MLELPESLNLCDQLRDILTGREIVDVQVNASPHKFAFFKGDPGDYPDLLSGKTVTGARPNSGQAEIIAGDYRITFTDGCNIRYFYPDEKPPQKHQFLLAFDDRSHIACSIQMYGCIWVFREGEMDHPYYLQSRDKPSPLSSLFDWAYFSKIVDAAPDNASVKALLATEQRIPGLGNGVLQDILLNAGVNPQTKLRDLKDQDFGLLFQSIKETLFQMAAQGGRDTEKDLFNCPGGYQTKLSHKTFGAACPNCSAEIERKAYMGGTVYYCPRCQPYEKEKKRKKQPH